MKKPIRLAAAVVFLVSSQAARADAASGVAPHLLSRGTYDAFNVKSKVNDPETAGPFLFSFHAKADAPMDLIVREHVYAPLGRTGWHTHPGPVFITVTEGTLWIYEYDDPTCTPIVLNAGTGGRGDGYVDTGNGHIAINPDPVNEAVDMTVITAPVGLGFRGELEPPQNGCAP